MIYIYKFVFYICLIPFLLIPGVLLGVLIIKHLVDMPAFPHFSVFIGACLSIILSAFLQFGLYIVIFSTYISPIPQ